MSNKLQQLLSNVSGNTIISLDTVTVPKLKGGKKNPMQGLVQKKMKSINVMVFTNEQSNGYENMVNRRLEKEGFEPKSFEVGPRAWGQRIPNTPFVLHNDQLYLEVIFLKSGKPSYTLLDAAGNEHGIFEEEIEGLPESKESEDGQGGLSDKVIIRTFKADNIKAITINGEKHVL